VTQVQCQSVKGKSHVVNVHGLPKYYFDIYYSTIIAAHLEFQIERRMQAASYKHNTISSEKKIFSQQLNTFRESVNVLTNKLRANYI